MVSEHIKKYLNPIDEKEQEDLMKEAYDHDKLERYWEYGSDIRMCAFCGRLYKFGSEERKNFFCSDKCAFFSKVLVKSEDDCWLFMSSRGAEGYGWIKRSDKTTIRSHRYAFELHNGYLPEWTGRADGLVVMHTCDNRACCNPKHLKIGTHIENMRDMAEKGRAKSGGYIPSYEEVRRGEDHPLSRLKEDEVRYILESVETSGELAKKFSIDRSVIKNIRSRRVWAHVEFTPPNIEEVVARRKSVARECISKAKCKPVTIDNVEYKSIVEAAEKLGVKYDTLKMRLRRENQRKQRELS